MQIVEVFKMVCFSRLLVISLLIIFTFTSSYFILGQPEDYILIYRLPRAYSGSEWIDSRALYMREEIDTLYFYVEFYGSMPDTSWDWRRQVAILIDSDRDNRTGDRYEEIGVDYAIIMFVTGDASVSVASLLRWNKTINDFQEVKDLKSNTIINPRHYYVEVKIDKNDIRYTSRGFNFYVVTTGEWGHSGEKPWLEEFSYTIDSTIKEIRVDGEADDWNGVHPLISIRPSQDTPQHFLVSKIYVANDNENLYLRVDTFEKPRVTVDHGEIRRYLYFFIDKDNNDATGDTHYYGGDIYVEAEFFSRQNRFNNVSYYKYTGEIDGWYERWSLLSRSNNSSDFGQVFELQIPLTYINTASGKRIGIFIPWGFVQILNRKMSEEGALSYPPITTTTSFDTTTTQTYSSPLTSTIYTERTSTTSTTSTSVFQVMDLEIVPRIIKIGERSTISVKVKNHGCVKDSYDVILRINGTITDSEAITLEPGQSSIVKFNYSPRKEGTYYIDVNGLTGTLKVVKVEEYNEIIPAIIIILIAIATLILVFMISRRKKRIPPPPPP